MRQIFRNSIANKEGLGFSTSSKKKQDELKKFKELLLREMGNHRLLQLACARRELQKPMIY